MIYLAILVTSLDALLMLYGYMLTPRTTANRIFAILLLTLAANAGAILLLATAVSPTLLTVATAVRWLSWLGIFPLFWLLIQQILAATWSQGRRFWQFLAGCWLFWALFGLVDWLFGLNLLIQLPANVASANQPMLSFLTGTVALPFRPYFEHLLYPLSALVLWQGLRTTTILPAHKTAVYHLMAILLGLWLVNGLTLRLAPEFSDLTNLLLVGLWATGTLVYGHMVAPVHIALRQLLPTAVFGILLFDKEWNLLQFNETARQRLQLDTAVPTHTLATLLQKLAPTAVNPEQIDLFLQETAVNHHNHATLDLILQNPDSQAKNWLHLQFAPIYEQQYLSGIMCTVEDRTAVCQTQTRLEAANKTLEQFAYQAHLLNDITRTGIAGLDMNTMLQRFADRLGDLFVSEGVYITLWDPEKKRGIPAAAYGPVHHIYAVTPPSTVQPTVTQIVLESRQPFVVEEIDNSNFAYFYNLQFFTGNAMLGLPLAIGTQKLGAIIIIFKGGHQISKEEVTLGEQAASQIALAITRERLFQAEREQRELAETLRDIGTALTATTDYDNLLDIVFAQIQRIVPYDTANITLLEKGKVRVVRANGYEKFTDTNPIELPYERFSIATAATFQIMLESKQPLCLSYVRQFPDWVETEETNHIESWIGVPLLIADSVTGFLCVDKTQAGFYKEYHKNRLAALAHQAALVLQHAQLFTESRWQSQQLRILNDLSARMVGLIRVQELIDLVVKRLYEDFKYHNVSVFLVDAENRQDVILYGLSGDYSGLIDNVNFRQSISQGIIGQVVMKGEYILANDTINHPDFFQFPNFDTRSELAVPIKTDTAVLGVLNVDSHLVNTFTQADVTLLTGIAGQLAVALQKARLFEQTLQSARELEILGIISAKLREAHTVQEMLPIILENTVTAVKASLAIIYLFDQKQNQVVAKAVYPETPTLLDQTHTLQNGIAGHVAATSQIYTYAHLKQDPLAQQEGGENSYLPHIEAGMALPMQTEQKIIGVIHICMAQTHHFDTFEKQLLTSISDIAANALHRAQVMESLEERVNERTWELQQAYSRLQELDRLKSKFISDVTHELRTPVANLNLYLDLLRMGRSEKQQHYLQVIETQTARLTQIVETTMQMPDAELLAETTHFQAVDMVEVVSTAVTPYKPRLQNANLHLNLLLPENLPPVWGAPTQLGQIVHYLLSNAVNYTLEGHISIALMFDAAANAVRLEVSDTGMGIDDEDRPYIFDRFYRGRKVSQLTVPGVGLGLTLAREIVEKHHGRIELVSTLDHGTSCFVWLPIAETKEIVVHDA